MGFSSEIVSLTTPSVDMNPWRGKLLGHSTLVFWGALLLVRRCRRYPNLGVLYFGRQWVFHGSAYRFFFRIFGHSIFSSAFCHLSCDLFFGAIFVVVVFVIVLFGVLRDRTQKIEEM